VPVAVLAGADDALIPPAVARALAAALPDAVLTVLPDAGHLSPLEVPDAVANALLGLLLRVTQPSAAPAPPPATDRVRSSPAGAPAPPE
jgi:alpha-beta hydrolase superfamily lysophospholipase